MSGTVVSGRGLRESLGGSAGGVSVFSSIRSTELSSIFFGPGREVPFSSIKSTELSSIFFGPGREVPFSSIKSTELSLLPVGLRTARDRNK